MAEPFDDKAKALYRNLFQGRGLKVETEYHVYFRSRSIDLVVDCSEQDHDRLREPFCDVATSRGGIRSLDQVVEVNGKDHIVRWLLGQLWNCTDVLPGDVYRILELDPLTTRQTYAAAVREVLSRLA